MQKNVLLLSWAVSLTGAGIALLAGKMSWSIGLIAGSGVGMINFYLLWYGLEKARGWAQEARGQGKDSETLGAPRQESWRGAWRAQSLAGKFFLRYLFLAAAFFAAYKMPGMSFLSFVCGFFLVHLVLGLNTFWRFVRSAQP